jgi:hypothetical protein
MMKMNHALRDDRDDAADNEKAEADEDSRGD